LSLLDDVFIIIVHKREFGPAYLNNPIDLSMPEGFDTSKSDKKIILVRSDKKG
jgi:hypothetical protein